MNEYCRSMFTGRVNLNLVWGFGEASDDDSFLAKGISQVKNGAKGKVIVIGRVRCSGLQLKCPQIMV